MQVPAAALVFRSDGPHVGVVGNDNRITFRKVTIVRDNGNTVQLGPGVAAGDRVALNISNQIVDGDTVEAHELVDRHCACSIARTITVKKSTGC